jgi:hypothetical protein
LTLTDDDDDKLMMSGGGEGSNNTLIQTHSCHFAILSSAADDGNAKRQIGRVKSARESAAGGWLDGGRTDGWLRLINFLRSTSPQA